MKKIISYILLAVSVFGIFVGNVSALTFDDESISWPNKLKEGDNNVSITGYDDYTKKYQILKLSEDSKIIELIKDESADQGELETEITNAIQDDSDSWNDITDGVFKYDGDLEAGYYLVIIRLSDTEGGETYAYKMYQEESNSATTTTENKDTGINDTLLIIGVPMLLIAGVYLTTKKQYN